MILLQISFAQINIFSKFGYTHNDIHPGNILYHNLKSPTYLKYNHFNCEYFKSTKIQSDIEFILSDFEHTITVNHNYLNNILSSDEDSLEQDNTVINTSLYNNIRRTISIINDLALFPNNEKIKNIYLDYQFRKDEKIVEKYIKSVKKYVEDNDEKIFRKQVVNQVEKFVYDYYILIKDVSQ